MASPTQLHALATWTSPTCPPSCASSNRPDLEFSIDGDELSYFLSKIDLYRGDAPGMSRWRKALFLATAHLTADAADYFGLPRDRTVVMGSRIEV